MDEKELFVRGIFCLFIVPIVALLSAWILALMWNNIFIYIISILNPIKYGQAYLISFLSLESYMIRE